MNVRTLLSDAEMLLKQGRFESALALVLMAIAATSRKRYPRNHPKYKKDQEAFEAFVRDEMKNSITGLASMTAEVGGKEMPMESILYKILRCTVLHEGKIPEELVFEEKPDWSIRPAEGRLVLSRNWILGLMRAVVRAKENEPLFKDVVDRWKPPWGPGGGGPQILGDLHIRIRQDKKP